MKPIDAVWKMIGKVAPDLTPQKLFQGLLPDYDPNLSDEENKKRIAKTIASGKFGEKLAIAAQKYLDEPLSQEESEKANEEVINIYREAIEIEEKSLEKMKNINNNLQEEEKQPESENQQLSEME